VEVQCGGQSGKNLFITNSQHKHLPNYCMLTKIERRHVLDLPSEDILLFLSKRRPPFKIEYTFQTAEEDEEQKKDFSLGINEENFWKKIKRYVANGAYYLVHFLSLIYCGFMGIYFFSLLMARLTMEKNLLVLISLCISISMMALGFLAVLGSCLYFVFIFDAYQIVWGLYIFINALMKDFSGEEPELRGLRVSENYLPGIALFSCGVIRARYWWAKYYPEYSPEDVEN